MGAVRFIGLGLDVNMTETCRIVAAAMADIYRCESTPRIEPMFVSICSTPL